MRSILDCSWLYQLKSSSFPKRMFNWIIYEQIVSFRCLFSPKMWKYFFDGIYFFANSKKEKISSSYISIFLKIILPYVHTVESILYCRFIKCILHTCTRFISLLVILVTVYSNKEILGFNIIAKFHPSKIIHWELHRILYENANCISIIKCLICK